MSKYRIDARKDANEKQIVKDLEKLGYSVATNHDDLLIGGRGLTFWVELKDKRALDKNGKIKEKEIKPSQKILRDTWRGHYIIASSLDQILLEMRATFKKFGV